MTHLTSNAVAGIGVAPTVTLAQALSSTRVRVVFSEPMAAATLGNPADYTITEDLGSAARTVTAVLTIETMAVVLQLDGVLTPGVDNYNVEVADTATDVAGNGLDPANDSADFNGFDAAAAAAAREIGLLAGITSAIGDEITDLGGFRSTRLTANFNPEELVDSGVNNATSVDAGINITFPAATIDVLAVNPGDEFRLSSSEVVVDTDAGSASSGDNRTIFFTGYLLTPANLVAGDIFRIDSGDWDGLEIEIETITSTTLIQLVVDPPDLVGVDWSIIRRKGTISVVVNDQQITLSGVGLGGNITNQSWEIVHPADTTAQVETTYRWDTAGDVFIDDVWYKYTGTTPTTITGLSHYDGVRFVPGAKQLHLPLAEAVDFTRDMSALDAYRRSFLIEYAVGPDLDIVARNLNVLRPPGLSDDDTFRELTKVVAYSHRGTRTVILNALDVLFGVGGYEVFEDLTGNSNVGTDLNHTCTIYIRRTNANEEEFVGKTFADGFELRALSSTTSVTLGAAPIRVSGVRLAPEPGFMGARLIGSGVEVSISGGDTITDPTNSFPTNARRGDVFVITAGPYAGERATILTVAVGTLTVCDSSAGESGVSVWRFSFSAADSISYTIIRPVSNFRFYRPTDEAYIVSDAGGTVTQWTYTSGTAEGTATTLVADDASAGDYFQIDDPGAADVAHYTHACRILPESNASFTFLFSWAGTLSSAASSFNQVSFRIEDGERNIAVGIRDAGGGDAEIAFFDTGTGNALGSVPTGTISGSAPWVSVTIVKLGRDQVYFEMNGSRIADAAYSAFASTTARQLRFGCQDSTLTGFSCLVKQVDWKVETAKDLWNVHFTNGSTGATPSQHRLIDGDAGAFFQVGDVGKVVRVHSYTTKNTSDVGNLLGEWEITARNSADEITINGRTEIGGTFQTYTPNRMSVRGNPRAFVYPNNVGHSIEILAPHPNAGTYAIDALLDPVDATRINGSSKYANTELTLPAAGDDRAATNSAGANKIVEFTNILDVVDAGSIPPFIGFDQEATWRMVPNMDPQDTGPIYFELCDAGSVAGAVLTFRQNLNTWGIASGEIVLIERSRVLTGQAQDSEVDVTQAAGVYSHYPFYLYDNIGSAAEILEIIRAAGVIPDFDHLIRDSAGLHIMD